MRVKKFRVFNYKSIIDSGYCWLSSDLTILAGKNESGKTAALEALRDFDASVKEIPESSHPLDDAGTPLIEICFDVQEPLLQQIFNKIEIELTDAERKAAYEDGVTIIKDAKGAYVLPEQNFITALREGIKSNNVEQLNSINNDIGVLRGSVDSSSQEPQLNGDTVASIKTKLDAFCTSIKPRIQALTEDSTKTQLNLAVQRLIENAKALVDDDVEKQFEKALISEIPHFIFFSDFETLLPFDILITEATKNSAVVDFAKITGLDLDKLTKTKDLQRRRNMLRKCSATVTGEFYDYWEQNKIDLIAEPDGDKLRFGVSESNSTTLFKISQRSKGFQWFLSFYLRLNAQKSKNYIIVIDEPGLYLHAKAQQNVLKVLQQQISTESQVIFSTHSPYLIDTERLDRVRLVIRDKAKGTQIENKIHKDADVETLTPIITAIGYSVGHDFSLVGENNIVVEGISDYYYLQALRLVLQDKHKGEKINFIPSTGADNIPKIVSLLVGWGLEFKVIVDNDDKGQEVANSLKKNFLLDTERIIFVSAKEDDSIEDLFSKEDFNGFVLDGKKNENHISNSKFLKQNSLDKVLLSKRFFDLVAKKNGNVKLASDTINSFHKVFEQLPRRKNKQG